MELSVYEKRKIEFWKKAGLVATWDKEKIWWHYDESFHTRVITKGYIEDDNNCLYKVWMSV